MIVTACAPEHADARVLVDELSATLALITGDSGKSSFDPADVRGARARFVVARAPDGVLLGCGALRPLQGEVAELKRMFARPGTHGVGQALLLHLEQEARRLAYGALWLETRRVNTRAVAFYLKHGYREIAPFGHYVGRPEAICLGKAFA